MPASPQVPSHLGDPPAVLDGFPRYRLRTGTEIGRNHPAGHGPWWFAHDGNGRFDLSGGKGTCYLAQRPVGGLLEVFKGFRVIGEDTLDRRREFAARVARPLVLANCCVAGAAAFGVNAEIHSTTDYGKTQRWATAFAKAGFDGIRYFLRSDPSLRLIGYAVFGDAGEPKAGVWPPGPSGPVATETVQEAARYGLRVVPAP